MFYDPANDVQRPTHPRLHLRDVRDAHTLFEAVRLGVLKRVQRRLNDNERSTYIKSGAVFVWEESEEETGLKRWTDGRIWSQSRMREVSVVFRSSNHLWAIIYRVDFSPTCSMMRSHPKTSQTLRADIRPGKQPSKRWR